MNSYEPLKLEQYYQAIRNNRRVTFPDWEDLPPSLRGQTVPAKKLEEVLIVVETYVRQTQTMRERENKKYVYVGTVHTPKTVCTNADQQDLWQEICLLIAAVNYALNS